MYVYKTPMIFTKKANFMMEVKERLCMDLQIFREGQQQIQNSEGTQKMKFHRSVPMPFFYE